MTTPGRARSTSRGVVVVDAAVPDPTHSAGDRAVVDLLDALVALGEPAVFVGLGDAPGADAARGARLRERGIDVRDAVGLHGLRSVLAEQASDVMIVSRPGPAALVSVVLDESPVVAAYWGHDLHADRFDAQARYASVAERARRLAALAERTAWERYPIAVYPSTEEAREVGVSAPRSRPLAMPYYRLTADDLRRGPGVLGRHELLFVGGAAHAPNLDAVAWAVHEILPALASRGLDHRLTVVGEWPDSARRSVAGTDRGAWIDFIGRVDESTLRHVHHGHRKFLAPLRFGAGVQRKLVAAAGLGLPMVTTDVGARGLLVRDAGVADGVVVADTVDEIVDAVAALDDDAYWEACAWRAHRRVTEVYRARSYDRHIADLLAELRRPVTRTQPGQAHERDAVEWTSSTSDTSCAAPR